MICCVLRTSLQIYGLKIRVVRILCEIIFKNYILVSGTTRENQTLVFFIKGKKIILFLCVNFWFNKIVFLHSYINFLNFCIKNNSDLSAPLGNVLIYVLCSYHNLSNKVLPTKNCSSSSERVFKTEVKKKNGF